MRKNYPENNVWDQLGSLIFDLAGRIRYGKVEVTIHDSRVVQLEIMRKYPLPTLQTKPESTAKHAV